VPVDALQTEVEYLAAAAAGDDEGLPGIPQPAVVAVQSRKVREALRRGQSLGDVVGERLAATDLLLVSAYDLSSRAAYG
jgi:hypothetical protein